LTQPKSPEVIVNLKPSKFSRLRRLLSTSKKRPRLVQKLEVSEEKNVQKLYQPEKTSKEEGRGEFVKVCDPQDSSAVIPIIQISKVDEGQKTETSSSLPTEDIEKEPLPQVLSAQVSSLSNDGLQWAKRVSKEPSNRSRPSTSEVTSNDEKTGISSQERVIENSSVHHPLESPEPIIHFCRAAFGESPAMCETRAPVQCLYIYRCYNRSGTAETSHGPLIIALVLTLSQRTPGAYERLGLLKLWEPQPCSDCASTSAVTGLVRLLVGWLEKASKSQPVRSFDWLLAGWF